MFVGHYGPAAAAAGGRIKLWHAVLAVQVLDLLWAPFILLGVESARVVPGITAANPLDLYHMPWTHSLPMALVWSVTAGGAYALVRRSAGLVGGLIIGALVFSHWITDYWMHRPDLELWFGGPKVGLGLWNNLPLAISVELGLFAVGVMIYLARTAPRAGRRLASLMAAGMFAAIGVALQLYGNLAPPPSEIEAFAISGLGAYVLFALLALGVDATRETKPR